MSHLVDGMYDVYNETERRAAKDHYCSACREKIAKGHRCWNIAAAFQGSCETIKRCARCQVIHNHLRTLGYGELWPDERLNCGEEYREHWGVEPPPEIAALAFALPGEVGAKGDT